MTSRRRRVTLVIVALLAVTALGLAGLRMPLSSVRGDWVGFVVDGLGHEALVTTAVEGRWSALLTSARFGWPGGTDLGHFFTGDYLHLAILKLAASGIGVGWAMNLYLVVGFPLAAATAAWFAARSGLRLAPALVVGAAFSLLPYHLLRIVDHFFLGQIWTIPLSLLPALLAVQAVGTPAAGAHLLSGWGRGRRDLALVIACSLLAGASGAYQAVFTLLVWVPTALMVLVVDRRALGWLLSPVLVASTAALTLLPGLLLGRSDPLLAPLIVRDPVDSLTNAGTLADLLGVSRGTAATWEAAVNSPAGVAALGIVVIAVLSTVLTRDMARWWRARPQVWLLTCLCWLLLWWLRGGLGFLFALSVSPQFRSLGRLLPFIVLVALVLAAHLLVVWVDTSPMIESRRAVAASVTALAVVLTVVGAARPAGPPVTSLVAQRQAVTDLVQRAQVQLPDGCPLGEAPFLPLPEGVESGGMTAQDGWGPVLVASEGTPTSQGALRNTRAGAWLMPYAYTDVLTTAHLLAAVGYCGVVVDVRAFGDPEAMSAGLTHVLGRPLSTSEHHVAFSLARLGSATDAQRRDLLTPAVVVPRVGSTQKATGTFVRARSTPRGPVLAATVINTADAEARVLITEQQRSSSPLLPETPWSEGQVSPLPGLPRVVDVPAGGSVDVTLEVPPGRMGAELSACRLGATVVSAHGLVPCGESSG